MHCLSCGCEESKVIDSRLIEDVNSIKRRRECVECGRRFTTFERIEETPILVIKRNGERQLFRVEKIKNGIIRACEKRPVTSNQIDEMTARIEKQVLSTTEKEIESSAVGELVMSELEKIDKVAYIRFASVYKQFEDVSKFKEFIEILAKGIVENK